MQILFRNIRFKKFIFIFIAGCTIYGCTNDHVDVPDVSHIDPQLEVLRFEESYAAVDTSDWREDFEELQHKYPLFFDIYFQRIMADRPIKKDEISKLFIEIVEGNYLNDLLDSVRVEFQDLDPIIEEFARALQYYRYYFDDYRPKVLVTFISEFGVGACTIGEDTLGLGLDMYLGEGFSGYDPTVFPTYIQESMTPDFIPIHLSRTMIQNNMPGLENNRMIDLMMHNGKILYALERILPAYDHHMLMEYTKEQMDWVQNNELQIWSHFLSNELLYSTRKQDYQKLTGPSPNAPGMPQEAPGQTANWIGWQIVKAYMKRHPDVGLQDLMMMSDAQELLEASRYRP